jgi:putative transposase
VDFFAWYNDEHYHSGLGLFTPHDVHHGKVDAKIVARRAVLQAAFDAHPERFPRGLPQPAQPARTVWINPPKVDDGKNDAPECARNDDLEPTLTLPSPKIDSFGSRSSQVMEA